jgi:hypothetical protein
MQRWIRWWRFVAVAAGYLAAFLWGRVTWGFALDSPWFVVTAMICLLGLASVAQPLVAIRVPARLRAIREWETRRGCYHALGVPWFGSLLRRTPLRVLNLHVYVEGGRSDTTHLLSALAYAEASHFWDACLFAPVMIWFVWQRRWAALCAVALVQVALNVYPIMHLRLSRGRLERVVRRMTRPDFVCG